MLLEIAEYLLTPCSRAFRRVGYLQGQLGIKVRHRQCRKAWEPHLQRTKAAILAAVRLCPQHRKCVIMGSGRLLDIPLKELTQRFQEVILVDTVHPPIAYAAAAWYRNVRIVCADITGTAQQLTQVARRPELPLPQAKPELFCYDVEIDYVASVNLLSQLAYLPSVFLEKTSRKDVEIRDYSRSLIVAHLEYLCRLPGVVTLITDYEKWIIDQRGKVTERIDILEGIALPWPGEEWNWNHVPMRHLSKEYAFERRVRSIASVKAHETTDVHPKVAATSPRALQ